MQTLSSQLEIDAAKLKAAALVFRAVNHPLRQRILRLIDAHGAISVTEIYKKLRIEQSVASQHLRILRLAGVVEIQREGRFIWYSVHYARLRQLHRQAEVLTKGGVQ